MSSQSIVFTSSPLLQALVVPDANGSSPSLQEGPACAPRPQCCDPEGKKGSSPVVASPAAAQEVAGPALAGFRLPRCCCLVVRSLRSAASCGRILREGQRGTCFG